GETVAHYLPENVHPGDWNVAGLEDWVKSKFGIPFTSPGSGDVAEALEAMLENAYNGKTAAMGEAISRGFERSICLHILDTQWKDHLHAMDTLREGIGLRAFGQKDPLVEYQHEAYLLFSEMIARIKEETVEFLFKVTAVAPREQVSVFANVPVSYSHPDAAAAARPQPDSSAGTAARQAVSPRQAQPEKKPYTRADEKVGRNDLCPCGSGKKYKKCCGQNS
ncbi:MAG: SEC-C metal-binding domain-containing protein, partial [Candidatus Omnitrophica bacterium]|nr:SEC-C metal-binding domain-containing protein [Candidatus Omnitrophota bacterium]